MHTPLRSWNGILIRELISFEQALDHRISRAA
jgi:hypothetical protein